MPGAELVGDQRAHCRAADPVLAALRVIRRVDHGLGGHLGLVDRRDGLGVVGRPGQPPGELRGVHRRHLHHRDVHVALVVQQLTAQRFVEALGRVLGAAGAEGLRGRPADAAAGPVTTTTWGSLLVIDDFPSATVEEPLWGDDLMRTDQRIRPWLPGFRTPTSRVLRSADTLARQPAGPHAARGHDDPTTEGSASGAQHERDEEPGGAGQRHERPALAERFGCERVDH